VTSQLKLRDKTYEVPSGMTVRDALLRLEIEPESVLPTRNGELITDDELLREGETVRLVAVISGGAGPPRALPSGLIMKGAGPPRALPSGLIMKDAGPPRALPSGLIMKGAGS
jgi:sulfur carrier protein